MDILSCNPPSVLAVSAAVTSDSSSGDSNSGAAQENELSKKEQQNSEFSSLYHYLEEGILPEDRLQAKRMVFKCQRFGIVDRVLYYENPDFRKHMDKYPIIGC